MDLLDTFGEKGLDPHPPDPACTAGTPGWQTSALLLAWVPPSPAQRKEMV